MKNKKGRTAIDAAIERALDGPQIQKTIQETARKTLDSKLDPVALADRIEKKMNKCWEDLALKMLGMDNRWGGKWEVDHCNGRQHSIGDMLKQRANEAVSEFLKRAGDALPSIEIEGSLAEAMVKEYNDQVKRRMKEVLRDRAAQDVEDFVNAKLEHAIDLHMSPEAEAVHALRETIKKTKDPAAKAVLENSLKVLEDQAFNKLG